ncbi:MAG: hypothetical protein K2X77_02810 [Candidatus Obscuribacterales bacterium]|nr:hypothetical protein [Candidatus Obscuribacterales bacterium]
MQSTKTAISYHCSDGSVVKLGRLLGSGGEGDVFECQGNPRVVAKIYHKQPHAEHSRKLSAMAAICSADLERIAAWPSHTLSVRPGGPPIGFLMRRFGSDFREVVSLYNPMDRKKLFPQADFSFLAHTAVNLAAAFDTMHSAGIVVGDVNQKNILVNPEALIRLIDCDSFQITYKNERFRCRVGVPDYTPPELQGLTFDQVDRCANHDNFGLAVIVFSLLMMGRHPFSGIALRSSPIDLTEAIQGYHYAYGAAGSGSILSPPTNSPPIDMLSPSVIRLFERAFSRNAGSQLSRPSSSEWLRELKTFRDNLLVCPRNSKHKFGSARSNCPWCEFEQRSVFFFIATISAGNGQATFATNQGQGKSWTTNKLLYSQCHFLNTRYSTLSASIASGNFSANAAGLNEAAAGARRALTSSRVSAGLLVACMFVQLFDLQYSAWFAIIIIIWWLVEESDVNAFKRELVKRRAALDAAQLEFASVSAEFSQLVTDVNAIRPAVDGLHRLAKEYNVLEPTFEKERKDLEQKKREIQESFYLSKFMIEHASIPNFGPNRKATLRSFGVYTAADVNEAVVSSIHGLGGALVQTLLDWRASLLRQFTFDPNKPLPRSYLDEMNRRYAAKSSNLERDIKAKMPQVEALLKPLELRRSEIEPRYKQAQTFVQQAKTDLEAVS